MRGLWIAFLSLSLLFASSATAEPAKTMAEVEAQIASLAAKHGASNVLVVFDIDDTLLKGTVDLGGNAWWDWQYDLLKHPTPDRIAPTLSDLIDIQYQLYAVGRMAPVEDVSPEIVKRLKAKGHSVFALTARGPLAHSVTVRELERAGYVFDTAPHCGGLFCAGRGILSREQLRLAATQAGVTLPEERLDRVNYSDGVLTASGQDKGLILRTFLASLEHGPFEAIVLVDDGEKNVKAVTAAFQGDPRIHGIHYTYMAENGADFLHNRSRQEQTREAWSELRANLCNTFGTSCGRTLRVASWNLANLYHVSGEDLPGRPGTKREDEDYARLQMFARRLEADIVALQEVNSVAAIQRVFPAEAWQAILSPQKEYEEAHAGEAGAISDGIYTGFAVRNGIEVVSVEGLPSLGVPHTENGETRPTRWGLEIVVKHEGKTLRFISVHLKSRCGPGDLDDDNNPATPFANPLNPHCTTLAAQLPKLDEIVDVREAGDDPFFVLGDFNRPFDVSGRYDHLWKGIDDRQPQGARLWRYPFNRSAKCWQGTPFYFFAPIDFIVADDRANALVVPRSQEWIVFDDSLEKIGPKKLSDHCPLYVDLRWSPTP